MSLDRCTNAAFLESCDFEDAVRKGISLGGDSDTIACMAGSIAEAHYGGVPSDNRAIVAAVLRKEIDNFTSNVRQTEDP